MDNKIYIDYCGDGKGRHFFPRIKGRTIETHKMKCLGECERCKTQFRADVTYHGTTNPIEEDTATEFIEAVRKYTLRDLTDYIRTPNQHSKK